MFNGLYRYVDTFNQGGGTSANLFQFPSVPSVKPAVAANAKFFVPTPAPSNEQTMEAIAESKQEDSATNECSYQSPKSSTTIQRFPSLGNISNQGATDGNNSHLPHSRRTASWSGSFNDSFTPQKMGNIKPLGEALGMPPSRFSPDESLMHKPVKSSSYGEDLHEVEF